MTRRPSVSGVIGLFLVALFARVVGADPDPGGHITLTVDAYEKLLRAAEDRPKEVVARPPVWSSMMFRLAAHERTAELATTLEVSTPDRAPALLPFPDLGLLVSFETLEGGCVLAYDAAGQPQLLLTRVGMCRAQVTSRPKVAPSNDHMMAKWNVPSCPVNHIDTTLPNGDRWIGTLAPGEAAEVYWNRVVEVAPSEVPEELIATAREQRLYRLGDDTLQVLTRLDIEILRGRLTELLVTAPADLKLVEAQALKHTVTSFQRVKDRPDQARIEITPAATDSLALFWLLERPLGTTRGRMSLPDIGLEGIVRAETLVAVTSPVPTLVDFGRSQLDGYERIDESEVTPWLQSLGDGRLLLGARRVGTATPVLDLEVARFAEVAELSGIIDHAQLLTMLSDDGRRVDRMVLNLRSRDAVLRIPIPAESEIWSVLLDGEPVRPLPDGENLLMKLSGRAASDARTVEVVVAYKEPMVLPERSGTVRIERPPLAYAATQVTWDVLLPDDFRYRHIDGNIRGKLVTGIREETEEAVGREVTTVSSGPSGRSEIRGTVRDPDGGVLPGVSVSVASDEGWRRTTFTNGSGDYSFPDLAAGRLTVRAELQGFAPAEVRNIELRVGWTLKVDLVMPVAGVTQSLEVTAAEPIIDYRSGASDTALHAERKATTSMEIRTPPPALSDAEREALDRATVSGVATIPVELPETGRRIQFMGYLLVEEAPWLEIEVKRSRKR